MAGRAVKHDLLQKILDIGWGEKETTEETHNEILSETESNELLPGMWHPSVIKQIY